MSHEFGIYPKDFTPEMFWGARAIIKTSFTPEIFIPTDRQNFECAEKNHDLQDAFMRWINEEVIPAIDRMVGTGFFRNENEVFTLDSEDGRFHCEASTLYSLGGYVYIGCWVVPCEAQPAHSAPAKGYKFIHGATATIPVTCLIEDYQTLMHAIQNQSWEEVATVLECLGEVLTKKYISCPEMAFCPSPSSLIAMGVDNGILAHEDGTDFKCARGLECSSILLDGVQQCEKCESCPANCEPQDGVIVLENGFTYTMGTSIQNESLLESLSGEQQEK